jgi:hypothetical protein
MNEEIKRLKRRIYELECVILKLSVPFENEDPVELARIAVRCYKIPIHGYEKDESEEILN